MREESADKSIVDCAREPEANVCQYEQPTIANLKNLLAPALAVNDRCTRTIILEKSAENWGDNCELRHSPLRFLVVPLTIKNGLSG